MTAALKGSSGFFVAVPVITPPDDHSGVFGDGRWAAFFATLAWQGGAEMA